MLLADEEVDQSRQNRLKRGSIFSPFLVQTNLSDFRVALELPLKTSFERQVKY